MESFRAVGARLSNWGRWGEQDQRGTLNLITPERTAAAAALIRRGQSFDLSISLGAGGPQAPGGMRVNPLHFMSATGHQSSYPGGTSIADDYVVMPLQAGTQWDGLSHVYYDGQLYNGYDAGLVTAAGAARNAVDSLGGVTGAAAVLLDVARLRGVEALPDGAVITPDDLTAAEQAQGVTVQPGDVVLVRTGQLLRFRSGGAAAYAGDEPGLGLACCPWLHGRDVAALASDNHGIEVLPGEDREQFLPVHCVLLRDLGMPLGEIWDLEALAADCAQDGVWRFFLSAPVLRVAGAVGSPVTPIALK
jgi:kynurenine formamidase